MSFTMVVTGGQESDTFEVIAVVKQRCVSARFLYLCFLVAVTLVFTRGEIQ